MAERVAPPFAGGDGLPLYVLDEAEGGSVDADSGEQERRRLLHHGVQQSLTAVSRAAHDLSERLAVLSSATAPPAGYESLQGLVIHITRHLAMAPDEATTAFDRWLASASGPVTTARGSLRLMGQAPPAAPQMRAVRGRLRLRVSCVPLPVELELVPWGLWRTVITLHPDRRFGWTVGPHRRSRYFAAGHATMDVIIRRLRALDAAPDLRPYDPPACGPSSSTRIPARTA